MDAYFAKEEMNVPNLPPPFLPMPAHAQTAARVSHLAHTGSSLDLYVMYICLDICLDICLHICKHIQRDVATLLLDPRIIMVLQQVIGCARRKAKQQQKPTIGPSSSSSSAVGAHDDHGSMDVPSSSSPSSSSLDMELRLYKARLATRIFHGIGSPRLPMSEWKESPFWMKYREWKFEDVEAAIISSG